MMSASTPRPARDETMQVLALLADPKRLKAAIAEYTKVIEDLNAQQAALGDAMKIASTLEEANKIAQQTIEAARQEASRIATKTAEALAQQKAREISLDRREGAMQVMIKEHNEAHAARTQAAASRERTIERRERECTKAQNALKQQKDALDAREIELSRRVERLSQAMQS